MHTASSTRAHRSVGWVFAVATNVSNTSIIKTLALEGLSVHVLDTPKASSSDSSLSRTVGSIQSSTGLRMKAQFGRLRKWTEEAGHKVRHAGESHDSYNNGKEKNSKWEIQLEL